MCEHNLRRIRNSDNNELFKEAYNKQTNPMHTMTNVLNLANIYTGKYIRQHVKKGDRTIDDSDLDEEELEEVELEHIKWYGGEYDEDSKHQWWYNRFTTYLLNVANGVQAALRKAYETKKRVRHMRKQMQRIRRGTNREATLPKVKPLDPDKTPITREQLIYGMQWATDLFEETKGWNWLRPHLRPRKWPGNHVWEQLFGLLGFGVMLIAHGKDLAVKQKSLRNHWMVANKELIRNIRTVWVKDEDDKEEWNRRQMGDA